MKVPLKKGIVDVKLAERPTMADLNRKHQMNICGFDNRAEHLMVVKTWALMKTLGNKTNFILVNELSSKCLV